MLTIKGTMGEVCSFVRHAGRIPENVQVKFKNSGLDKMPIREAFNWITDATAQAHGVVNGAFKRFDKRGGKVLMLCSDKETRASTAVLRSGNGKIYQGTAVCNPSDIFDPSMGQSLALARALDEYWQERGLWFFCADEILNVI